MKDLITSIIESLDGDANLELYPFLPYLLQDLTEIGTDPLLVEKLIRTNIGSEPLKVLDLGCGKGAVSVHLAKVLGYHATGIDGMQEFIDSANRLATINKVAHFCSFSQGDIRNEIAKFSGFDMVILGAIGPVFGFIGRTLATISSALNPGGYVIIDDAFKEDGTLPDYDRVSTRTAFYQEITDNGFRVVDEIIIPAKAMAQSNRDIQDCICQRAEELKIKHPEKAQLFNIYIQNQEAEIETMENNLVVGIWLLGRLKVDPVFEDTH